MHHVAALRLHGLFRGPELRGDLLVQPAGHDQRHDLALPGGQGVVAIAQRERPGQFLAALPIALERVLHGVEQRLIVERLGEDVERAGLHRPDGERDVGVRGQEDHREIVAAAGESPLQVQAAQPGHADIEQQATGAFGIDGLEEVLGHGEGLGLQPDRSQQPGQRSA